MDTPQMAALLALLALAGSASPVPIVPAAAPAAPREVEIVATDYAFKIPTTVAGGRTNFRFTNSGRVVHELNITLLKRGVTLKQFMEALIADRPVSPISDGPVGVLFAEPGTVAPSRLSTELLPGRTYAVICIFRDSAQAKQHFAMGMFGAMTVAPAAVAPSPASGVDTIVGAEYAYVRYPRTLAPGHHSFAFVNEGKVRHEINVFLLKKGVTLQKLMEVDKAGGDGLALIEADFGVLHASAGKSPLGRLEFEMLPGRDYAFVCTFSNDDKSPPHEMLGMGGEIHVSGARAQ